MDILLSLRMNFDKFANEKTFPIFQYLNEMRVEDSNLLNIVRGMQYYPLNKLQFLRVHNFVQNIESSFSSIEHTVVLSKNKLIWYVLASMSNIFHKLIWL